MLQSIFVESRTAMWMSFWHYAKPKKSPRYEGGNLDNGWPSVFPRRMYPNLWYSSTTSRQIVGPILLNHIPCNFFLQKCNLLLIYFISWIQDEGQSDSFDLNSLIGDMYSRLVSEVQGSYDWWLSFLSPCTFSALILAEHTLYVPRTALQRHSENTQLSKYSP